MHPEEILEDPPQALVRSSENPSASERLSRDDLDPVTGVPPRRSLDADLHSFIARAESENCPLSLVMIDVDNFKKINDGHGHPKGDAVLRGIGMRLAQVTRSKGRVYRYGGEEFTILLDNHTPQEATAVAERARRLIETVPIEQVAVTASFGVATFPDHCGTPEQLVELADQALRDAKNRGRNLVRVHGDAEPVKIETERKQPRPGAFTGSESEEIRQDYFRTGGARCPRDQAILKINERRALGVTKPKLMIWCGLCGLTDEI